MLGILEDNVDAFVLEDDLDGVHHVRVRQFGAQGHFSDGGLRNAGVLDLSLLVRLEPGEVSMRFG